MSKLMAHILSFSTYWTLNTWRNGKKTSSLSSGKISICNFYFSARLQIDKNESIFESQAAALAQYIKHNVKVTVLMINYCRKAVDIGGDRHDII